MVKIEGEFVITKDEGFFIDNIKLKDNDEVYLTIEKLKQIIRDAKEGLI